MSFELTAVFDDLSYADVDADILSWLEERSADEQRWALEAFIAQCEEHV